MTYVVSMSLAFLQAAQHWQFSGGRIKLFFQNLGKKKDTTAAENKEKVGGEFDPMEEVDPMDDKKS